MQMKRLFKDRPFIAFFRTSSNEVGKVDKSSTIYQWAVTHFYHKETGDIVLWNSDSPKASAGALGTALSDNVGKHKDAPPYIRISNTYQSGGKKSQYIEFETLWLLLVYELNNVTTSYKLSELIANVHSGDISRDEFIRKCARMEYTAMFETDVFYKKIWTPWAKEQDYLSDPSVWKSEFADTFEKWLKRYDGVSEYPWGYFGKIYDTFKQ